jgi:outer membrane protein assembly factor BamB
MRNAKPGGGVLAGGVLLLAAGIIGAQDWPQWRGPNRDAKATGFTAPQTWPKELTKKWKVPVGGGDASPSLLGDRLYVFARQDPNEVLHCLDANTGKELWQDKYEAQPAERPAGGPHAGPRSSPTVAEGKVVTLGVRGVLSCLDAATGKVLWRKDDFKGWPRFFTASSPLIVDGLAVAQLGGGSNGVLVAYDLATGDQKWKSTGESPGYASPVLMTVGGTKLIIAETERRIVAVTAADGKLVWEAPFAAQGMGGYNASTPVVDGETLIYGGSGRGETAVKLEKQGDGFVAKELWSNKDNSVIFNTPVLKNGLLVGLSQGNQFFAINAQAGQTAWTAPGPQGGGAPGKGGGFGKGGGAGKGGAGQKGGGGMRGGGRGGYGSIVDAGPVLMALTPGMQLIVFQAGDKEFKQLASYKVADSETYAYPVVSGNRIYIKDQDSVTLWTID